MHETHLFLVLDSGHVEPLPHRQYVKLLRGELAMPDYANETVRLADWYVEVQHGRAVTVHNETYSLLHFDEKGCVREPHDRRGEDANRAFYDALLRSAYSDPDDDPAVQGLRKELGAQYAWRPSDAERAIVHALVFGRAPPRGLKSTALRPCRPRGRLISKAPGGFDGAQRYRYCT